MDMSFNRFRKQLRKWKDKFKKKGEFEGALTYIPTRGRPATGPKGSRYSIPETIENVLAPERYDSTFMNVYEIFLLHFGHCKNFNECPDESWCLLRGLYQDVLRKDPLWHFFYEGEYSIIRCSGEFTEDVCNYLERESVVFTEPAMWMDDSPTVRRFHSIFTVLFHSFSVLAMEYDDEEWFVTADRVIHCYMNHQWYRAWAQYFRRVWGEDYWEGMALSEHALRRSGYQNWSRGMLEERARNKRKEE
jgi:hypothetical protein